MTSTERVIEKLSAGAKSALVNTGSSKVGTKVFVTGVSVGVFVELVEWGLIGPNDGLTNVGARVREALVAAALEEAFG